MAPFRDDDDEKPMMRLLQRLVEAREARSLFGDTTSQLWLDADMEADLFLAKYGRSCAAPVRSQPTPARGPAISWYCGPAELSPHVDGLLGRATGKTVPAPDNRVSRPLFQEDGGALGAGVDWSAGEDSSITDVPEGFAKNAEGVPEMRV